MIVHLVNGLCLLVLHRGDDKTFLFCHIADVGTVFCHLGDALRKDILCAVNGLFRVCNAFHLGDILGSQCLHRFFCHLQQDRISQRLQTSLLRHAGSCLSLRAERQV